MRKLTIAMLAAAALLAAGCGGEDSGTDTSGEASGPPQPKQPIAKRVDELNKILASGDCEGAAEITFSILREKGKAGAPATDKECEFLEDEETSFLNVLADIEFENSEEFGTVAMAEGEPLKGEDVDASISTWVLDVDGEWRYLTVGGGDVQIGASQPEGSDADEVAARFVREARQRKCEPEVLHEEGTLAFGDQEEGCKVIEDSKIVVPDLKASPDAEPVPIGETLDWAFYGVDSGDGYYTLLLNSVGADPGEQSTHFAVYDFLPSE
jgi:hypothetical protein